MPSDTVGPATIYHLTPAEYFDAADRAAPYVPEQYAADGFIHCTDGIANVVDVANRYYRDDPREYVLLVLGRTKIAAPVRYEDPARIYPHIYGPLNRDAIMRTLPMPRTSDGTFVTPTENDDPAASPGRQHYCEPQTAN